MGYYLKIAAIAAVTVWVIDGLNLFPLRGLFGRTTTTS